MSKIAVLGSGQVGEVLANGFLKHGHDVMRGSRDVAKLSAWKNGAGPKAQVGTFDVAAKWAQTVVLAVKGSAAEAAIEQAGVEAPVTSALAHLIEGSLPLEEWVALVRARQPEPARFGGGWFRRFRARFRRRRN